MRLPHEPDNVAGAHGAWGEDVAAEFLRRGGYQIVERNARPVKDDARFEIDIVAYDRLYDTMVFFEVKQHAARSPYQRRTRSVNRRKRNVLRRACNAWRRVNKWRGDFRFDVIEVYGVPGQKAEVDHIPHVELFARPERFVRWG